MEKQWTILPHEFSKIAWYFLVHGAYIVVEVTGKRRCCKHKMFLQISRTCDFGRMLVKKKITAYTPGFTVLILCIIGKKLKKVYLLSELYCLHRVHGLVYDQPCERKKGTLFFCVKST